MLNYCVKLNFYVVEGLISSRLPPTQGGLQSLLFKRPICSCMYREDYEFLVRNAALPMERMKAVETGGCPHAAIREDYSQNIEEVRQLTRRFQPDFVLLESGGDNLAANFSRQLADFIIYVIDVSGECWNIQGAPFIFNSKINLNCRWRQEST